MKTIKKPTKKVTKKKVKEVEPLPEIKDDPRNEISATPEDGKSSAVDGLTGRLRGAFRLAILISICAPLS